ncbi:MFS transporter, DHA1 family, inner membrane transport protein [Bryocella elongata]|uniref:MFS transporter, DHA1 family, inner membrane transport protein n=1 Tax=Bryocella elongata TaxID=863522 RepID=A0A1H6ADH9_9BACT|nr:MFS transporter [Bryocella elongata]SEG45806.1 MFS transporter, DHA1 family, inner membrane transport protein [Bryocella elongata]
MRKPILALTAAAFGIGTTEFIIMGLLPQLASDFHVSIPRAGLLVSGYALSVTMGSPVVALALSHMDRKRALLILLGLFIVGNTLCGLAPSFGLLLAARILTALAHGSFFGIGSVLATQLVPKNERAQAIALMFTGLTVANILGVPAGTALGLAFGWRASFFALAPIGLIAAVLLVKWVPHQKPEPLHLMTELRSVLTAPVQLVLAMSTVSSVSMFCVLTYIAPMLEEVTHLSPHTVTWVLVLFGLGITIGNTLGGWLSDWKQLPSVLGGFAMLAVCFAAMPFAMGRAIPAVIAVFVWGLVHFAAAGPFQPRIVEKAHSANLASTLNQSAFNFGNALGASLGGLALTRGLGYAQLPWLSAGLACVVIVLALAARRLDGVLPSPRVSPKY